MWGTLSDEGTGLSFTIATGSHQCSHSRVQVPWASRPYSTVSDLRLPVSLPPTTHGATLEVFSLATTRDTHSSVKVKSKLCYNQGSVGQSVFE
jgi:hypothetical protein